VTVMTRKCIPLSKRHRTHSCCVLQERTFHQCLAGTAARRSTVKHAKLQQAQRRTERARRAAEAVNRVRAVLSRAVLSLCMCHVVPQQIGQTAY
jgi:hypothetical protein